MNKFFVYGTLKEGGFFAKNFDVLRKSSVKATLKGYDLFKIGTSKHSWFPGIVSGTGEVIGEVHEYSNENVVRKAMDRIEGFNPDDPENSFYVRRILPVELEDGSIEEVFVYTFNGRIEEGYEQVKSGIWEI